VGNEIHTHILDGLVFCLKNIIFLLFFYDRVWR